MLPKVEIIILCFLCVWCSTKDYQLWLTQTHIRDPGHSIKTHPSFTLTRVKKKKKKPTSKNTAEYQNLGLGIRKRWLSLLASTVPGKLLRLSRCLFHSAWTVTTGFSYLQVTLKMTQKEKATTYICARLSLHIHLKVQVLDLS